MYVITNVRIDVEDFLKILIIDQGLSNQCLSITIYPYLKNRAALYNNKATYHNLIKHASTSYSPFLKLAVFIQIKQNI